MQMILPLWHRPPQGLQQLIPGPFQWTCGGEQLEIFVDFKYLGILFNAVYGMAVTFPMLKRKMFGAWALLKRQYGRLQCTHAKHVLGLSWAHV